MEAGQTSDRTLQAAERGDIAAMRNLASHSERDGDLDGAELWLRRAADAGDIKSMRELGNLLQLRGDVDGAMALLRKRADTEDAGAMFSLGVSFQKQGEIEEAVAWYRRSAEAGYTRAMHNLAGLLLEAGDFGGAEEWFRRAAEAGDARSMAQLGRLVADGGDLAAAEAWYRRAVENGNAHAIALLGHMLHIQGDYDEAESLYRRAAERGFIGLETNLGQVLQKKGDLEAAEAWFRRASEAGDNTGTFGLASVYQNRGDLDRARPLYEQAKEAGHPKAAEALDVLRRKVEHTDRLLEAITFDIFGWEMTVNDDGCRTWASGKASLTERFLDMPPDLPSWNANDVRDELVALQGLVESPTFRIENEDIPDQMRRYIPAHLPKMSALLEVSLFEVGPAKGVLTASRMLSEGHVHFATNLMVLFAECFWVLGLDIEEGEDDLGEREAAVARTVLDAMTSTEPPVGDFDPYDRRWDGVVPLENDPLTRIRVLVTQLRESIKLGDLAAGLAPFTRGED